MSRQLKGGREPEGQVRINVGTKSGIAERCGLIALKYLYNFANLHIYLHIYIPAYIHTYLHTYTHRCHRFEP